eukprot:CAMPEP_0201515104 /NCGR_PEP_ID=MMETSP0161_2-20130828/6760_1 /ASSEMBLY_ACC=CAM_ASM_000251 /TAXON_ID=180227 /ORGANISM="Neoparamoeba aestuarina, Strain SoJaBio B1-5/56/2" /LENGTH=86 /DNA_ID=CAMNT_0047911831 /DNA_START=466 /DNA_END=723 /DNA_ORIENTATION=-
MFRNYYSVQCDWVYFGVAKGAGLFAAQQMVELNTRMLMWDDEDLPDKFDDLEEDDHDGDDASSDELEVYHDLKSIPFAVDGKQTNW